MSSPVSATNQPNYLEAIGLSIDEWMELTPEEREAKLQEALQGKSTEEIEEALTEIAQDIRDENEQLKELENKLKDKLATGLSEDQEARVKQWLEEIEAIEDELKAYKNKAEEVGNDISDHQVDLTDGTNMNVSNNSLELDGQTYTYSMGSAGTNPFGEEERNIYEGVTSDGTANGHVIKDVNGDTFLNHDDIEQAIENERVRKLEESQKVFIDTKDRDWQLVSNDNGDYTFKVTDKDGNYSYVTFKNAKDVTFIFRSGLDSGDLNEIKNNWPTELLKNSYWDNAEKSFYESIERSESEDEISQNDRNKAIKGYKEVIEGLASTLQYAGHNDPKLTELARKALEELYAALDKGGASQIDAAWEKVFKMLEEAGLNPAMKSKVMKHIIFTLAKFDPENASVFISPVARKLEGLIQIDESKDWDNTNGKVAILIIETLSQGGNLHGGVEGMWKKLFDHYDEDGNFRRGEWKDYDENKRALEIYEEIFGATGIEIPEAAREAAEQADRTVRFSNDTYDSLTALTRNDSGPVYEYGFNYVVSYGTVIVRYDPTTMAGMPLHKNGHKKWAIRRNVQQLWDTMREKVAAYQRENNTAEVPTRVIAKVFLDHFKNNERISTALPAALAILKEQQPELYQALLDTPGFREQAWNLIKDRPDAGGYEDVKEWLGVDSFEEEI